MSRANLYRWLRSLTSCLLNNIFFFAGCVQTATPSGSFQFLYHKFLIVLWSVLRFHVRVLYLMCVNSIALYVSPCFLLPRPDRTHRGTCSTAHSYGMVHWRSDHTLPACQLLSSSDWSGNYNFLSQCRATVLPTEHTEPSPKSKKQNNTEFSNGGEHEYWNRLGCSTVCFGRKITTGEPAYICHPECKDRKFCSVMLVRPC